MAKAHGESEAVPEVRSACNWRNVRVVQIQARPGRAKPLPPIARHTLGRAVGNEITTAASRNGGFNAADTDTMKALTLWQPWASLVAIGAKVNETRPGPLAYNGELAIHAAKLCWRDNVPDFAIPSLTWLWRYREKFEGNHANIFDLYLSLPFGKVVCVVDKAGCISTGDDNGDDRSLTKQELDLGDYSPGRFYYPLKNCRRLIRPVACAGKQGVFFLDPGTEGAIRRQL